MKKTVDKYNMWVYDAVRKGKGVFEIKISEALFLFLFTESSIFSTDKENLLSFRGGVLYETSFRVFWKSGI